MFKALIVALAAVAAAVPTRPSSGDNVNQCANGAQVRCCNKDVFGQTGVPVIIDALSSECGDGLGIDVIPVLKGNKCDQQISCCSEVNQNGIINIACTPIEAL